MNTSESIYFQLLDQKCNPKNTHKNIVMFSVNGFNFDIHIPASGYMKIKPQEYIFDWVHDINIMLVKNQNMCDIINEIKKCLEGTTNFAFDVSYEFSNNSFDLDTVDMKLQKKKYEIMNDNVISHLNSVLFEKFIEIYTECRQSSRYSVDIVNNNLKEWVIKIKGFDNKNLNEQLEKLKINDVTIKLSFDCNYTKAPIIDIFPIFTDQLNMKICNMKIFKSQWNKNVSVVLLMKKFYKLFDKNGKLIINDFDQDLYMYLQELAYYSNFDSVKNYNYIDTTPNDGNQTESDDKIFKKTCSEIIFEITNYLKLSSNKKLCCDTLLDSLIKYNFVQYLSECNIDKLNVDNTYFNVLYIIELLVENENYELFFEKLDQNNSVYSCIVTLKELIRTKNKENKEKLSDSENKIISLESSLSNYYDKKIIAEKNILDRKKTMLGYAENIMFGGVIHPKTVNMDILEYINKCEQNINNDTRMCGENKKMFSEVSRLADNNIFITFDKKCDVVLRLLIIGPDNTPFKNGCFFFNIYIPKNYPLVRPIVEYIPIDDQTYIHPFVNKGGSLSKFINVSIDKLHEGFGPHVFVTDVIYDILNKIFVKNPLVYDRLADNTDVFYETSMEICESLKDNTVKYNILGVLKSSLFSEFDSVIKKHYSLCKDELLCQLVEWKTSDDNIKDIMNLI